MRERAARADARPADAPREPSRGNLGKAWEKTLNAQHDRYRLRGSADIDKLPTPIQPLGDMRQGVGGRPVFTAAYQPAKLVDFTGLLRGGRCVRLEAKCARMDRVDFDAVSEHQAAALHRCDDMGGLAVVAILIPAGMWLVPWMHWIAPRKADGTQKKSFNPADLDRCGVRFGDNASAAYVLAGQSATADWLSAATTKGWV